MPRLGEGRPAHSGSGTARWAAFWCLPYLLLGMAWVFTNPPGAAPDEPDHLVKAIAAGRLDVGAPFDGTFGDSPAMIRNASIARTVLIPSRLAPDNMTCYAFQPNVTAACLPDVPSAGDELVARTTPVGAYPVMGYIPLGIAANLATDAESAFRYTRMTSLGLSLLLLFLAVWHLSWWLGRAAPIGLALGVTPVAVFTMSSISMSGVEIAAASAVAGVTVVATRHPASLSKATTLALLAVSGSALILSRQLGIVTFGILAMIALSRGGFAVLWSGVRRGSPAVLTAAAALALSTIIMVIWERRYDHPALTGSALSADALSAWLSQTMGHILSGIGRFGWLDSPLPSPAVAIWIVASLFVIGTAILTGRRADLATIGGVLVAVVLVSYVVYATVFHPIGASLQGRHLLPLVMLVPILAGVMLVEFSHGERQGMTRRRQALLVGATVPAIHFVAVFANGHRYAVGVDGPWWFLPTAQWSPDGGWLVWILVAGIGATTMATVLIRSWDADERVSPTEARVEPEMAPRRDAQTMESGSEDPARPRGTGVDLAASPVRSHESRHIVPDGLKREVGPR